MASYLICNSVTKPVSPENYTCLYTFSKQLLQSKQWQNRDFVKTLFAKPSDLLERASVTHMTKEKADALLRFTKRYKVNWITFLQLFGANLQNPVDVVLGFNIPRYIRAICDKTNIPCIELTPAEVWYSIKVYTAKGKGEEMLSHQLSETFDYHQKVLRPAWNEVTREWEFVEVTRQIKIA